MQPKPRKLGRPPNSERHVPTRPDLEALREKESFDNLGYRFVHIPVELRDSIVAYIAWLEQRAGIDPLRLDVLTVTQKACARAEAKMRSAGERVSGEALRARLARMGIAVEVRTLNNWRKKSAAYRAYEMAVEISELVAVKAKAAKARKVAQAKKKLARELATK